MSISGLRWSSTQYQRLLGRDAIRVSTQSGSQARWRDATGTLEIEFVPWMGDYKISRMIHHLSPN